jgi:hypothetical protein
VFFETKKAKLLKYVQSEIPNIIHMNDPKSKDKTKDSKKRLNPERTVHQRNKGRTGEAQVT